MESEDYNEVLARKLLLEALEAFDSGQYDYAKVLAEKSLSLDKNSIDGNLIYFSTLIVRGDGRSLNDLESNNLLARKIFTQIMKKRKSGDFLFNEMQDQKLKELLILYNEFRYYVDRRGDEIDGLY